MRAEITVLTPLHISSGERIDSSEYLLDECFERVDMLSLVDDPAFNLELYVKSGVVHDSLKRRYSLYSAYIHPSTKNSLSAAKKRGARGKSEVLEHIKSYINVYVPGSSLKGAIRTALLMWALKKDHSLMEHVRRAVDVCKEGDKGAARSLEKAVFGTDPHNDILRALIISDSNELEIHPGVLSVEDVRVSPLKRGAVQMFVEAIRPNTRLNATLRVDEFLLERVPSELGFMRRSYLLEELSQACNAFAREVIEHELDYFETLGSEFASIVEQYEGLRERLASVPKGTFLLRVGWGAGYISHTIGALAKKEKVPVTRIVKTVGRKPPLQRFPTSRKVVYRDEMPSSVLGWLEVKTG